MNSTTTLIRPIHFAFLLAVLVTACSKEETKIDDTTSLSSFSFGKPILVKVNTKARIGTANDTKIDVQVSSIADSRCPIDVVCVWEGRAEVTFVIDGIDQPVTLCLGNTSSCIGSVYQFTVNSTHYQLTLKAVTPFPSSSNQDEEKEAEFVLEIV